MWISVWFDLRLWIVFDEGKVFVGLLALVFFQRAAKILSLLSVVNDNKIVYSNLFPISSLKLSKFV